MRRVLVATAALAALAGSWQATTQACTIDGRPTLTVNGRDVVINKTVPSVGSNLSLWAPFVLNVPLRAGTKQVLAEIKQAVPLRLEAFRTPWRWNFGDGTAPGRGFSVTHAYAHSGTYKVTVDAYFPSHKFWYTFDAVQIHVVKG